MKSLIVAVSVMAAGWALAQPPGVKAPRAGELATRETPGSNMTILDIRKEATDALAQIALKVQRMTTVKTVYSHQAETAKGCGLTVAQEALKSDAGIGVVVVICDAGEAPALAVYPEDRMAVINAQRVLRGAESQVALVRLEKEIFRAVAYIAGGIDESTPSALKPVLTAQELDALKASTFSPAIAMTIADNAGKFKFSRVETVPYRVAVMKGWAAAPTNDAQKEIWAKFKKE
jgi:hypothetical protein